MRRMLTSILFAAVVCAAGCHTCDVCDDCGDGCASGQHAMKRGCSTCGTNPVVAPAQAEVASMPRQAMIRSMR